MADIKSLNRQSNKDQTEQADDINFIKTYSIPYHERGLEVNTNNIRLEEFVFRGVHSDVGGGYNVIDHESKEIEFFAPANLDDIENTKPITESKQLFTKLYSQYFGSLEIHNHSATLNRNVLGELSNIILKAMYLKAKEFDIPFNYDNLYYKHGLQLIPTTKMEIEIEYSKSKSSFDHKKQLFASNKFVAFFKKKALKYYLRCYFTKIAPDTKAGENDLYKLNSSFSQLLVNHPEQEYPYLRLNINDFTNDHEDKERTVSSAYVCG